jgi:chromosome segregation protein
MQLLESEERLEEVEKEVKQLKRRLARLEPVNTSAVEEHREVRERYERLYSHWHELERGESALQRLSKKLDEAMERRFYATLEEVRNEFVDVFQLLFEGGTVDLVLTGEGTIWDRGIDVIAQPPGKKLQSLSLLSGGEKALTAISLLFAFIRCNPAPFVILDEIDTALDQTNLDRFARFLDEAADTNQFVLVTHQKRTMEEADVLYGVTMTGDGTSRIVSVKLSAAEELVAQG